MFDEAAERTKLEVLDLTEDVIDMIIKKKRATYESKNAVVIPIEQEPTYYPPCETPILDSGMRNVPRTEPLPLPCETPILEPTPLPRETPIPVIPEPPIERSLDIEPVIISKRGLPWQRRKYI